ncbi:hypothetical protein TNCV_4728921 [Trichonephila clavipes]|nr:hypothetical protein TNCV_4728921 [Trichonephila clavipes]
MICGDQRLRLYGCKAKPKELYIPRSYSAETAAHKFNLMFRAEKYKMKGRERRRYGVFFNMCIAERKPLVQVLALSPELLRRPEIRMTKRKKSFQGEAADKRSLQKENSGPLFLSQYN